MTGGRHPIRVRVEDDLRRWRLAVFFRLILAIPHLFWLYIWVIVALLVAIVNWFATLAMGRSPRGLHEFLVRYLRYQTHVWAYFYLAADPYPQFSGKEGTYPVDLEVDPPEAQRRLVTFFRLVLALPAFALIYALSSVPATAAFLGWFVCIVLGRMPQGLRNFNAYFVRYQSQVFGYAFLLTSRYPTLDPLQEAQARRLEPPVTGAQPAAEEPPQGPGP